MTCSIVIFVLTKAISILEGYLEHALQSVAFKSSRYLKLLSISINWMSGMCLSFYFTLAWCFSDHRKPIALKLKISVGVERAVRNAPLAISNHNVPQSKKKPCY